MHGTAVEELEGIQDRTETNLVNLRKVIYLTIMNALNYEEAVHKLLKIQIKEGQEVCVIETCVRATILIRFPFRSNSRKW
jgi:pre-mRNA-splicing factor CWC22